MPVSSIKKLVMERKRREYIKKWLKPHAPREVDLEEIATRILENPEIRDFVDKKIEEGKKLGLPDKEMLTFAEMIEAHEDRKIKNIAKSIKRKLQGR